MATKFYTARNNCIRAARQALGADAQPGAQFTIGQFEQGWTWAAGVIDPAKEAADEAAGTADKAARKRNTIRRANAAAVARGEAPIVEEPKVIEVVPVSATPLQMAAQEGAQAVLDAARKAAKVRKPKAAPAEAAAPVIGPLVPAWAPQVARGEHKPGSMGALLVTLMGRPEGWTDVELSEHLGKKHAISAAFQACARVGVAIYKRREGRSIRYFTVLPAGAQVAA